jgi:hypothetical protein
MHGIATIDRQLGGETIAAWVTNRKDLHAGHTYAVVIDAACDAGANEKVQSLTRCYIIPAADGAVLDGRKQALV